MKTNEVDSLELELILKNYEEILSIKRKTNFPLINASQLQNIAKSHLIELSKDLKFFDEKIFNKKLKFNFNHNLISIIILKCIENSPNIFNSYLDCELNSTLMGREPDVNYLERINHLFKEAFSFDNLKSLILKSDNELINRKKKQSGKDRKLR